MDYGQYNDYFNRLKAANIDIDEAIVRFNFNLDLLVNYLKQFAYTTDYTKLKVLVYGEKKQEAIVEALRQKSIVGNLGITPLYEKFCLVVERLRSDKYPSLDILFDDIEEQFIALRTIISEDAI